MPVILIDPAEQSEWLGGGESSLRLQRPLPNAQLAMRETCLATRLYRREEGARKACLASIHIGAMNTNIHGEWTGSEVLLLDYDGAAKALSMSRPALRDLVYKGRGPRVTKIGRRTFFAVKDLEAFIDRHREPATMEIQEPVIIAKRKRGRPTIAEQMAREVSHRY